jgi:type I restriction enzyme S subunit
MHNQELTELRDWLLPMLMNGQVRVGETPRKENYATQSDLKAPNLGMVAEDRGEYGK